MNGHMQRLQAITRRHFLRDSSLEMAAWTVVGNVLLNLDEMFAKR